MTEDRMHPKTVRVDLVCPNGWHKGGCRCEGNTMTDLTLDTLVKWTYKGGVPTHGTGRWDAGVVRRVKGPLVACENGIHAVTIAQSLPWLADECRLFTPHGDWKHIDQADKSVYRAGFVSEPLDTWDERSARLFAADCAERVVHLSTSDDRPRQAIEMARRFARGEATERDLSAAWSAAWSAAESAAWSAARSAARSAAWSAARSAAWSAAGSWQASRLLTYLRGEA